MQSEVGGHTYTSQTAQQKQIENGALNRSVCVTDLELAAPQQVWGTSRKQEGVMCRQAWSVTWTGTG